MIKLPKLKIKIEKGLIHALWIDICVGNEFFCTGDNTKALLSQANEIARRCNQYPKLLKRIKELENIKELKKDDIPIVNKTCGTCKYGPYTKIPCNYCRGFTNWQPKKGKKK